MTPNPQQVEIIKHRDGPCLVAAVPGSGKTASVTERIKELVSTGVEPSAILAITFTNKAAKEMRSRIAAAVGADRAAQMAVSTFHSMCARILRDNAPLAGLTRSYTIYDDEDQEKMIQACIAKVEERNGKMPAISDEYMQVIMGCIEDRRNSCLTREETIRKYRPTLNQREVVNAYSEALTKANAIDFTGLLSKVLRIFETCPAVLEAYQERWRYITVDEVQDTNIAQYRIVKLLGQKYRNIIMVGDLDQSLYKFRGAFPENVLQFKTDFNAKVLKLEKNYRSTPQILKHAQRLIENNLLREKTSLVTDNANGDPPGLIVGFSDNDMAEGIVDNIERRLADGLSAKEVAVFYRVNHASRPLELALRNRHIKYKVIGGLSFWKRKEIKACLALMKFMVNPSDRMSFDKCCDFFCRGVGPVTTGRIADDAVARKAPILTVATEFSEGSSSMAKSLKPFMVAFAKSKAMKPDEGLLHVAKNTVFWGKMAADSSVDNDRQANVEEMAGDVHDHIAKGASLADYLQEVSLLSSADEEAGDEVSLMTLHACKGLEFDAVYMSHCNQGILPHSRSMQAKTREERISQMEEERRLFYVGMTRARKWLSVAYCQQRMGQDMFPSVFIGEAGLLSAPKTIKHAPAYNLPREGHTGHGYARDNHGKARA
jgi:DNA helicase-2/ATP-dependent DNA helicase PcrA